MLNILLFLHLSVFIAPLTNQLHIYFLGELCQNSLIFIHLGTFDISFFIII